MAKNQIRKKIAKLKKITERVIEEIVLKVMKANEQYAIELNWDQLQKGQDRLGNKLPAYKSKSYAKKKKLLNPRGVTDLRLKGDFYEGFELITAKGFPVYIVSSDSKTKKLVEKYKENIFGLAEVNTTKFAKFIQPQIKEEISKLLQL